MRALRGTRLLAAAGIAVVGGVGVAWSLAVLLDEAEPGEGVASLLVPCTAALTLVALVLLPWGRWGPRTAAAALIVIGVAGPILPGTLEQAVDVFPPYARWAHAAAEIALLWSCLLLAFGAPLIIGWTVPRVSTGRAVRADAVLVALDAVFLIGFAAMIQVSHSEESPGTPGDFLVAVVALGVFVLSAAFLTWTGVRVGRRTAEVSTSVPSPAGPMG